MGNKGHCRLVGSLLGVEQCWETPPHMDCLEYLNEADLNGITDT